MGGTFFFFVESKSFEFFVEEGGTFFLLRIFERQRFIMISVHGQRECKEMVIYDGRLYFH